jgi:hypothetical protein
MACQSLDNDEILNVRWATEDPNPVQKVAEKRRLEEMGQEAIRARMDPKIVDAMRSIRALEDGDILENEDETVHEVVYLNRHLEEPEQKRRKLDMDSPPPPPLPEEEPPKSTGLLSTDTLEGLKYFAEIRKRNGAPPAVLKPVKGPNPPAGLGLADYGSDEDN